MDVSRRDFISTGVAAGLAAAIAGCASQGASGQAAGVAAEGEDGHKLWLRYASLGAAADRYAASVRQIVAEGASPSIAAIRDEWTNALTGMLGGKPMMGGVIQEGAVIVGTPASSPAIKSLGLDAELAKAGPEGYLIRSAHVGGHGVIVIASEGEIGALYGTFHFLRLLQTLQPIDALAISERPRMPLRMVNHWDNIDGTIERGYAGRSLWNWNDLPGKLSPRYAEYARAQASIGINGAVLNNVNANARFMSTEYLRKIAALAKVWEPYGIRAYLSVNFAVPKTIGGLATADPLDPGVIKWWKDKCDEIFSIIPNFGGFLVKANSEGQPGPQDYQRTHADGANVMADAIAPHGGYVIWRAFIYAQTVDPDRVKRAYIEFMALDGKFKPNVLIQVKNGPLDFQPREPFHPLFGGLKQTCVMAELQPSQEYLGQGKHLVYLGTMWEEFLKSDTQAKGPGSTVAKVLEGEVYPFAVTGMTGVLNPGSDTNWTGHDFCQANWYALGRLSWNPELSAQVIAEEWVRMTWSNDQATVDTIRKMMMGSRETFVNYSMPLGLHHMIGGNHYAPQPWNAQASEKDWTAVYYHQATKDAIGFDRTKTGDKAVEQYFPPVCDMFNSLETCPEKLLLWFHRAAWDFKLKNGQTLWEGLCAHYYQGVREAEALRKTWTELAGKVDPSRHQAVADRLTIQVTDATAWRDQILNYFAGINKLAIVKS